MGCVATPGSSPGHSITIAGWLSASSWLLCFHLILSMLHIATRSEGSLSEAQSWPCHSCTRKSQYVSLLHTEEPICHRQINIFMPMDSSISVWACVHVCTYPFCFYIYFTFWLGNSWTRRVFLQKRCRKMHRKSLTSGMVKEGLSKIGW